MRIYYVILLITIVSVALTPQEFDFSGKFNEFIKNNQPEKAEKLLNGNLDNLPAPRIRQARLKLAQSYYANLLYDKSAYIYELSGIQPSITDPMHFVLKARELPPDKKE